MFEPPDFRKRPNCIVNLQREKWRSYIACAMILYHPQERNCDHGSGASQIDPSLPRHAEFPE